METTSTTTNITRTVTVTKKGLLFPGSSVYRVLLDGHEIGRVSHTTRGDWEAQDINAYRVGYPHVTRTAAVDALVARRVSEASLRAWRPLGVIRSSWHSFSGRPLLMDDWQAGGDPDRRRDAAEELERTAERDELMTPDWIAASIQRHTKRDLR